MKRSDLRENIFKLAFNLEFCEEEEREAQIEYYLSWVEGADDKDKEYIAAKAQRVVAKVEEIDAMLNDCTGGKKGWKTTRMNRVDLSILRLAVYEMKWDEDVPVGVAINEAVELAKKYSGEEGPAFVNGVLAKLAE